MRRARWERPRCSAAPAAQEWVCSGRCAAEEWDEHDNSCRHHPAPASGLQDLENLCDAVFGSSSTAHRPAQTCKHVQLQLEMLCNISRCRGTRFASPLVVLATLWCVVLLKSMAGTHTGDTQHGQVSDSDVHGALLSSMWSWGFCCL